MRCQPIIPSRQVETLLFEDGDTADIIEAILYADQRSGAFIDKGAATCLTGGDRMETLKNVWAYVKKNHRYRADRPGHERAQSPGALEASGRGDCKSFSIMEGALLRALGFRYRYRFAAYAPGDFTHVYVVAYLPGGREVVMDAVHDRFDEEVNYRRVADRRPRAAINGTGRPAGEGGTAGPLAVFGVFTGLLWLLSQFKKNRQ